MWASRKLLTVLYDLGRHSGVHSLTYLYSSQGVCTANVVFSNVPICIWETVICLLMNNSKISYAPHHLLHVWKPMLGANNHAYGNGPVMRSHVKVMLLSFRTEYVENCLCS